jgi:hypothetical protein
MFFSWIHEHWPIVIGLMVLIMLVFIFVTGRGAEGGLTGRTKKGWGKWQELSRKSGELLARIVLTIFYFTVVLPFGLSRTFLGDPLRIKRSDAPHTWLARQTRDRTLEDARRQY